METPAFPGDTTFSQQWTARIGPGCPVNLSAITMSPHLGAHADAPLHYGIDAPAIADVPLDPFLGPMPCDPRDRLRPAGPRPNIWRMPPRAFRRACWSARARKAPTTWSSDFTVFAPETIAWLAGLGVRLVGIDAQSVDPADSKTLDSHRQLLVHGMRVLENLVLDDVAAGDYELIALPLRLAGVDASPVRAVLRSL